MPIARTLLIEQMHDAVLVTDVKGRILDANPQARQLLQQPNSTIIGKPIDRIIPALAKLIAVTDLSGRAEIRLDQYPPIILEVDITALHDGHDSPLGWLLVLRDITHQARQSRYQQVLSDCSQLLLRGSQPTTNNSALIDRILGMLRRAGGVARIDICQNIVDANGELAARIVAEEHHADVPPFPINYCIPWSNIPHLRDKLIAGQLISGPVSQLFAASPTIVQTLNAGGIKNLLLLPLYGRDGWWGILRASSSRTEQVWDAPLIKFLRNAADMIAVTIRQWETVRTIQDREHFIQRVAQATPDMIYVYDLQTDQVVYANMEQGPGGISPVAIIGNQHDADLKPDELAERHAYLTQIANAADMHVCSREYRVYQADGSRLWLLRRDTVFARDEQGQPTQILGVVQDVTERRHRSEALLRAKEDAEAANRAKSTFLSMMSHELRTPLTAIIGYSQLLEQLMAVGDYAGVKSDLHHIYTSGTHLLALINDVIELSRIDSGQRHMDIHPVNIGDLVAEVASIVRPLMSRNHNAFHVDCPTDIPIVITDGTKVRQIILNVLNNAAKFTEDGQITFTTIYDHQDTVPTLIFHIADTGIGIDQHQIPRIFDPFVQVDEALNRRYEGTGLGLALSQRLCEVLGGEISVQSTLGAGSIFTIRLPLCLQTSYDPQRIQPTSTQPGPAACAIDAAGAKIVVVINDNPAAGTMFNYLLAPEHVHIVHAPCSLRGIRLTRDLQPELIIIDPHLPNLENGLSAQATLEADPVLACIPVITINTDDLYLDESSRIRLKRQLEQRFSLPSQKEAFV
ncbi:ATP-binding protein [Candidatus Oscillochloris fontis]|uniref:ATP-binding protein n=1 Tax=Candidatus Oscillochloris fontis TaxID=2496868 RepID=UPI001375ABE2|nr:ATP-binding protein [Candidatus Oscillochloris fontis]